MLNAKGGFTQRVKICFKEGTISREGTKPRTVSNLLISARLFIISPVPKKGNVDKWKIIFD